MLNHWLFHKQVNKQINEWINNTGKQSARTERGKGLFQQSQSLHQHSSRFAGLALCIKSLESAAQAQQESCGRQWDVISVLITTALVKRGLPHVGGWSERPALSTLLSTQPLERRGNWQDERNRELEKVCVCVWIIIAWGGERKRLSKHSFKVQTLPGHTNVCVCKVVWVCGLCGVGLHICCLAKLANLLSIQWADTLERGHGHLAIHLLSGDTDDPLGLMPLWTCSPGNSDWVCAIVQPPDNVACANLAKGVSRRRSCSL